jgi:hypothetical protein
MYGGGFHSEYHIFLSAKEQESDNFNWRTWIYFSCMILAAVGSIYRQVIDRKRHLEAYRYKSHFANPYESYQQMRTKYQRAKGEDSEERDGFEGIDMDADK